jgi:hypothetical protein
LGGGSSYATPFLFLPPGAAAQRRSDFAKAALRGQLFLRLLKKAAGGCRRLPAAAGGRIKIIASFAKQVAAQNKRIASCFARRQNKKKIANQLLGKQEGSRYAGAETT